MVSATKLSLIDLYKLGSHRGNKASKLNPKLKKFVHGSKNGLSIIDLALLQTSLETVERFLYGLGKTNRQVLVVGTSLHTKQLTESLASKLGGGMPYASNRWLGGTLTNWNTVKKTLKTLEKNQSMITNEKFFNELSRNEQLILSRETEKLKRIFGGLATLKTNRPSALIVLDGIENSVAMKEADLMGVPVIAIVNTGTLSLPKRLEYTIVCNNHSTELLKIIVERFVASYNAGVSAGLEELKKDQKKQ